MGHPLGLPGTLDDRLGVPDVLIDLAFDPCRQILVALHHGHVRAVALPRRSRGRQPQVVPGYGDGPLQGAQSGQLHREGRRLGLLVGKASLRLVERLYRAAAGDGGGAAGASTSVRSSSTRCTSSPRRCRDVSYTRAS